MPITFVGQRSTGTWTCITDMQRNALLDRRIYVNVHTALKDRKEERSPSGASRREESPLARMPPLPLYSSSLSPVFP